MPKVQRTSLMGKNIQRYNKYKVIKRTQRVPKVQRTSVISGSFLTKKVNKPKSLLTIQVGQTKTTNTKNIVHDYKQTKELADNLSRPNKDDQYKEYSAQLKCTLFQTKGNY